jgi:hypothetical protein
MDPFIEGQRWKGFHTLFISTLHEMLVPRVRPRYVVEVEEYVYLARGAQDPHRLIEPDLAIAQVRESCAADAYTAGAATLAVRPVVHTLPEPDRFRQHSLTIRDREFREIVTVIEVLSPWNKTLGDGQTEYLVKRANILRTPAHLVELDLLRGGQRLPTREPLEPADYFAFVCRKERLSQVDVYAWTLQQPLPPIPVPLAGDDPDVVLELQPAFTTTYDRAGYDYALNYGRPVDPPLGSDVAEWAQAMLKR